MNEINCQTWTQVFKKALLELNSNMLIERIEMVQQFISVADVKFFDRPSRWRAGRGSLRVRGTRSLSIFWRRTHCTLPGGFYSPIGFPFALLFD